MYNIQPTVNKDFILSRVTQEEIFKRYLGYDRGNRIHSPFRKDNNPSATLYYDRYGRLILHDHRGDFHGDCFEFVMRINGMSFRDSLELIAKDFNLLRANAFTMHTPISSPIVEKAKKDIKVKRRFWNEEDKAYWTKYGITRKILELFNVAPVELVWVDGRIIYKYKPGDPAYVYYFLDDDYKVYFPFRDEYRFVCNTAKIQGYNQLPETGEILIITKAMKEVLLFASYNLSAIAPQSESNILEIALIDELKARFKLVISNFDFDKAGITGASRLRRLGIQPLFLTNGKYNTYNFGAKDITDYRELNGDILTTKLISDAYEAII